MDVMSICFVVSILEWIFAKYSFCSLALPALCAIVFFPRNKPKDEEHGTANENSHSNLPSNDVMFTMTGHNCLLNNNLRMISSEFNGNFVVMKQISKISWCRIISPELVVEVMGKVDVGVIWMLALQWSCLPQSPPRDIHFWTISRSSNLRLVAERRAVPHPLGMLARPLRREKTNFAATRTNRLGTSLTGTQFLLSFTLTTNPRHSLLRNPRKRSGKESAPGIYGRKKNLASKQWA